MKLGIILTSHSAETNWNALRLANLSLVNGDEIKIFLLGEGVEYAKTGTEKFNINQQVDKLIQHPKFFFFDVGALNGLIGNFTVSSDRIGMLFEHFIFNQITEFASSRKKRSAFHLIAQNTVQR